jgi:hypothetical protein
VISFDGAPRLKTAVEVVRLPLLGVVGHLLNRCEHGGQRSPDRGNTDREGQHRDCDGAEQNLATECVEL